MHDRITVNPKVCSGKPCIKGTRIMVKNILGMIAGGDTEEDSEVFEWAQTKQAIIITYDEHFADQLFFPVGKSYGIIRLKVNIYVSLCLFINRIRHTKTSVMFVNWRSFLIDVRTFFEENPQ